MTSKICRKAQGVGAAGGFAGATVMLAAGALLAPVPWVYAGNGHESEEHSGSSGQVATLYGTFRDFRAHNVANGHPDFEVVPDDGMGVYTGMVEDELGPDGKPVFRSTGYKQLSPATNGSGEPIIGAKPYIKADPADSAGSHEASQGGAVTSQASFDQWYRDVDGVNDSDQYSIQLQHDSSSGMWVIDENLTTQFAHVPGFGGNKNFSYTYEISMPIVFGAGDRIVAGADDCMWVFIDGKLVADLGGVHEMAEQVIDLDRLTWLKPGGVYTMKVFYAERKKVDSNFKLAMTFRPNFVPLPEQTALSD